MKNPNACRLYSVCILHCALCSSLAALVMAQQRHRVHRDSIAAAQLSNTLVGLALDADAVGRDLERARQVASHRVHEGLQLRTLGDHDDVDVRDGPTALADDRRSTAKEVHTGRTGPCRVGVGKMASNVSRSGRSE